MFNYDLLNAHICAIIEAHREAGKLFFHLLPQLNNIVCAFLGETYDHSLEWLLVSPFFLAILKGGAFVGKTTTVRLSDAQRQKLRQLANTLGRSPNATLGQLVDNATIAIVTRHEAVATLSAQKNNRYDAQNLHGSSITAVQG